MAHVDMREVIADLCDADEMAKRAAVGLSHMSTSITVDDLLRWYADHVADDLDDEGE